MNREIKFRVWCEVDKRMYYDFDIWWEAPELNEVFKAPHQIFMQYTGLKDVNGQEIYEGDIVRLHWEYPEDEPVVIETICDVYRYELDSSKCEVIGNIFEDKEV